MTAVPVTEAARRIVAEEGEWTAGDARVCAEFVIAAQDELRERVEGARAAMAEGDAAVVRYLRGERIDLVRARSDIATFLAGLLNAGHAEHPGPFCPVCGLVGRLQEALRESAAGVPE